MSILCYFYLGIIPANVVQEYLQYDLVDFYFETDDLCSLRQALKNCQRGTFLVSMSDLLYPTQFLLMVKADYILEVPISIIGHQLQIENQRFLSLSRLIEYYINRSVTVN